MKTKLTVVTPMGTVTRTTARAYAFVVLAAHARGENFGIWEDRAAQGIWSAHLHNARGEARKLGKYFRTVRIFNVGTGQEVL